MLGGQQPPRSPSRPLGNSLCGWASAMSARSVGNRRRSSPIWRSATLGEETRERLVGLLWSETEEEKARASLRQSLHEIREAFNAEGFDGLRTDKVAIGLDLSRID